MTTIPNLTLEELESMVRTLTVPANDDPDSLEFCDTCCGGLPGTIAPILPEGDDAHPFVECCGSCERIDSATQGNDMAAQLVAAALGLKVRKRFDDDSLRYYRVFLARPGSPDDRDTYCIGASWCGTHPSHEVGLVDGWRGFAQRYVIRRLARKDAERESSI